MQTTSKSAILYILRELGRRAGAAPDWIARWRVRFGTDSVELHPEAGTTARLVFPFDASKAARFAQLREAPPCRLTWMQDPGAAMREVVPDFPVLFDDRASGGTPLFVAAGSDTLKCCADILTSALWTLSRVEETVAGPSDAHGRFPASGSVAFRAGCLDRPIVDEYALAFRQALCFLLPAWKPRPSPGRLKLSHDIDGVGLPRSLRSTVGHLYPRRIPRAFWRDVLSLAGAGEPAYLEAVRETARISRADGYDSAFYWKGCARSAWDSGYDPEHPQVRAVIEGLMQEGFEMGVHPAYDTFGAPERLEQEVSRLRRVLGSGPMGGRQHFLRWRPSTWRAWEKAGLSYDSSVGFADVMGFRAGTAVPYHPWLMEEDRESTLLEIPLIVMDCTPITYMRLGAADTLTAVEALVRRCEAVGGVFTLLWHNSSVIEPPYASLYPRLLAMFRSRFRYHWIADLCIWPLPCLIEGGANQHV